jgi:hypothetical protein
MDLRFYERDELTVVDGGAEEILERSRFAWRNLQDDAFLIPRLGPRNDVLDWQVYSRPRFLELVGRVRRLGYEVTDDRVEQLLKLWARPAPVVGEGEAPDEPAVVLSHGELIGAWSLRRSPGWSNRARRFPFVLEHMIERDTAEERFGLWIPSAPELGPETPDTEPPADELIVDRDQISAELVGEPEFESGMTVAEPQEPAAIDKPVVEETLRRTPHLEVADDPPLEPGQEVTVRLYADDAPALPLERSTDIVIVAPSDVTTFDVDVCISASDHFEVMGEAVRPLRLERASKKSDAIEFKLQVAAGAAIVPGPAVVSALFLYGRRVAGKVSTAVRVAGVGPDGLIPCEDGIISVQALAAFSDMLVVVWSPSGSSRYKCLVRTADRSWGPDPWEPDDPDDFVKKSMARFVSTKVKPPERLAYLRGVGKQLFRASPRPFQNALWSMVEAGEAPKSVFVVTEEPTMPWELLVPNRRGKAPRELEPLGVMSAVGRWIHPCHQPPRQSLTLRDAYVIPADWPERPLKKMADETRFVVDNLKGTKIDPVSFVNLQSVFREHVASLLHFICHGGTSEGFSSSIYLECGAELDSAMFDGMIDGEAWSMAEPLVFLNACEAGRTLPALIGGVGLARTMIELGARGVIAPLWQVDSELAHKVAVQLYTEALAYPPRPFAAILQDIRRRAYTETEAEDTYAAYCYFGDPATGLEL